MAPRWKDNSDDRARRDSVLGLSVLRPAHQQQNQNSHEQEEHDEMKATGNLPGEHINQPKVIGAERDFTRCGDEIFCPECGVYFKSASPSLAITCPACKLSVFQFPDNVPMCPGCGTRGLCAIIDGVHWKLWVPFPPEVMQKFWEQ